MYKHNMRRVRATIGFWKSNEYYTTCVCICSRDISAWKMVQTCRNYLYSIYCSYWSTLEIILYTNVCTVMRRLTTGIRSKKCVVRRFRRCEKVYLHKPKQYILLHTQSIWYSLLLLGYKRVLNTVGNCNTMVSILMYNNII